MSQDLSSAAVVIVRVKTVDPDQLASLEGFAVFLLGLHCLPKYPFPAYKGLTHLRQMESLTQTIWTSPFPF